MSGPMTPEVRRKRGMQRAARNLIAVVGVTMVVALAMFMAIAWYAAEKNAEVPDPFIVDEPGFFDFLLGDKVEVPPPDGYVPDERGVYDLGAPTPQGGVRTCPATGCTASTCHAETGEMPPEYMPQQ